MLRLIGVLLITVFFIFFLAQPDAQYKSYYFLVIFGGGSLLSVLYDCKLQNKLYEEKRCHHCQRIGIHLEYIVTRITKYWNCDECPRKLPLFQRYGGSIISAISIAIFFVNPIIAHIVCFLGLIIFYLIRSRYTYGKHFAESRCYNCKRKNDTVRFIDARYIPKYFVCYQCPLQRDEMSVGE